MGKIVVITSGKGGTGKTTSAAAISSCLAALGLRTLCIDADAGLRNLDIALAMSDFTVTDVTDVLDGKMSVTEAAREHPCLPNLYFLAAPVSRQPEEFDPRDMEKMLRSANEAFDYVIVDSPAGLGAGFRLAVKSADLAVIVATCDPSSIRDASKTVETLSGMGVECRLLINRTTHRVWNNMRVTVDDVIDRTGARLIGVIREDTSVQNAAADETPLALYVTGGAAKDFLDVARRLRGEEVPLR